MFDWSLNMPLELICFECSNSALFLKLIKAYVMLYIILNKPFSFVRIFYLKISRQFVLLPLISIIILFFLFVVSICVSIKINLSKTSIYYFNHSLHKKWSFSSRIFFHKCDQISSFLRIWSHLLKKSLMKNFIFCTVLKFMKDFWYYYGQIILVLRTVLLQKVRGFLVQHNNAVSKWLHFKVFLASWNKALIY